MLEVVLDSDAVNPLAEPEAYELVKDAIAQGRLRLLVTHVCCDQVAATPNRAKRARLEAVLALADPVPTTKFVIGVSAFGGAALGSDDELFRILRGSGSPGDIRDALIASPAEMRGRTLCLVDIRATKRALRAHLAVITPSELLKRLAASS
jgi:hypothetical protein